jgi:uncharacterized protein involved in tolerance to divalent cations
MKYFLTALLVTFFCTSLSAQDQQTQIANVARKLIANTTDLALTDPNSRVSPQMEQQVRRIADHLSATYAISQPESQNLSQNDTLTKTSIVTKIKNIFFIGLGICVTLLILQVILKKYDEKKNGPKNKNITDVHDAQKNAPYVVALSMPSQTEAETLSRHLIAQHLIARADLLPQQHIQNDSKGVLLIAQTVNARLKTLQTHLQKHALTPLAIPILKGHKDHLQWIVNTADGRSETHRL